MLCLCLEKHNHNSKKNQPLFKIKENNCFEDFFVKVWFVYAFEKHSITIQKVIISSELFFLIKLNLNEPFCNLVFGN